MTLRDNSRHHKKMARSKIYTDLTDTIRSEIRSELDRTALTDSALVKLFARDDIPGPTLSALRYWMTGVTQAARKTQLSAVLDTLKPLPDNYGNSDEISEKLGLKRKRVRFQTIAVKSFLPELKEHMERTGLTGASIVRRFGAKLPQNLDAGTINYWRSGKILKADKHLVEAVLPLLRSAPDKPPEKPKKLRVHEKEEYADITPEFREFIKHHRKRTGLTYGQIVGPDKPEGLRAHLISAWATGATTRGLQEHIDYVRQALENADPSRIELTENHAKLLTFHIERTGVGPAEFVRNAKNAPDGVTRDTISKWRNLTWDTAIKEHIDYTINAWAALPDKKM